MLFNTFEFLFFFLPLTIAGLFVFGRAGNNRLAVFFLACASLLFYGWANPASLGLILTSIVVNYLLWLGLGTTHEANTFLRKLLLGGGITFNLGLLGYYKYADFFLANLAAVSGTTHLSGTVVQPLAISFFTFQQIAFLVDSYRGETREQSLLHYVLFVSFFPQLVAGPIVRHHETMPQYINRFFPRIRAEHVSIGLTLVCLGLFKKVVLADSVALSVGPAFQAAEQGAVLNFFDAWAASLAYTFQLYFDFSGYTDMALGIARIFGIYLPINFNSPYKAANMIEFWKRWHISLSRFLRDYLYIPLGGNRKGRARRYLNILVTMLLCGLWHGANWTFVAWGALHGLLLVVNHAWRAVKETLGITIDRWWSRVLAQVITFMAVAAAWVIFRAESLNGAFNILYAMTGLNGFTVHADFTSFALVKLLLGLSVIVFLLPNTIEIVDPKGYNLDETRTSAPKFFQRLQWQPNLIWMAFTAVCALSAVYNLSEVREFIYSGF
jgi:D-alanyl-lipoteichoic acid acyltransferase DltB (MBOAT superfamily)